MAEANGAGPVEAPVPDISRELATRAEIIKLERLLGLEQGRFDFLVGVPPEEIAELRSKATDRLFDHGRTGFARMAAGARLLPAGVAATIARRELGPLMCARLAGEVDPAKAVAIADRLDPEFLTEVAVELDPRRVERVLRGVPLETSIEVALGLEEREEWVAMARFVDVLEVERIVACVERVSDEALLRTAFVMEDKERLDEVLGRLDDERLSSVVLHAHESGMWAEVLDLLDHLSPERRGRLGALTVGHPDEVVEGLVETAQALELWRTLIPVLSDMPVEARRRFAAIEAFSREPVIGAIVEAVAEHSLWVEALPLVVELGPEGRERAAVRLAALEVTVIEELVVEVGEADMWADLLGVIGSLPPEELGSIAGAALPANAQEMVPRLAVVADEHSLWEPALDLFASMDAELREPLVGELGRLPEPLRLRVAAEISGRGLDEPLADVLAALRA